MPKVLVAYVRYIESVNLWLGKALQFGILVLVFVLVYEAVARYGLHLSTPWSIELATFVLGTYFLLSGGYTLLRGAHVNMDMFYERWSPRRRAIVNLATVFLLIAYFVFFIRGGFDSVSFAIRFDRHSASVWGPPLAPIKTITLVGGVLLLLQGIASSIRDVATIRGKPIS